MSKYADIEQIKKIIRSGWVKYMPSDLDINLSFALGKIAEVPTIEVSEDCISREDLRRSLTRPLENNNADEMYWKGWHDCTVAVETRIADAPSVVPTQSNAIQCVESVGRAEGEWINKQEKYQMAECSNCKKVTMHEMWGDKLVYYDFCPNCGAKMKG